MLLLLLCGPLSAVVLLEHPPLRCVLIAWFVTALFFVVCLVLWGRVLVVTVGVTCCPCVLQPGFISLGAAPSCDPCPSGQFTPGGQSICQNCTAGTYSDSPAGSCEDCPEGTFSTEPRVSRSPPRGAFEYSG